VTLAPVFDLGRMIAVRSGQATDLYFDRTNCKTGAEHIYKITDRPQPMRVATGRSSRLIR
jgi:hypothetical protein